MIETKRFVIKVKVWGFDWWRSAQLHNWNRIGVFCSLIWYRLNFFDKHFWFIQKTKNRRYLCLFRLPASCKNIFNRLIWIEQLFNNPQSKPAATASYENWIHRFYFRLKKQIVPVLMWITVKLWLLWIEFLRLIVINSLFKLTWRVQIKLLICVNSIFLSEWVDKILIVFLAIHWNRSIEQCQNENDTYSSTFPSIACIEWQKIRIIKHNPAE